jgi:Kef-type K+ transport system membrane component KefB/Trk K+ transport system NAD-binding subunit
MDSIFFGLSIILVIATLVALIMRLIGQPLIIGHIITGILVGPAVLNLITSPETFHSFSEIGVALLLFIIGLGLNPRAIKEVGSVVGIAGISTIISTAIIGWLGSKLLGFGAMESLLFGIALAFSSTIVVLKLLSDKREQHRLYAKIAIGMTLIEDIAATVALLFLTAKGENKAFAIGTLIFLISKGLIVGFTMYQVSSKVLPKLQKTVADSQEFLFLSAISWGFGSAALFEKIGLSQEVGALFAGICLSTLPFAQEVSSRLRPLRDFFIVLFFITLGSQLHLTAISDTLPLIFLGIAVVVIIKPLVALVIVSLLGYTKQTSFKASAMLGQAGEFSIIFMVLAVSRNLASESILTAITVVALVSIASSTYIITYLETIYKRLEAYLEVFEKGGQASREVEHVRKYDLILFGYQKGGHEFLRVFQQLKKPYLVVDYDPEMIEAMEHKKIHCLYGDATDPELLEEAGLSKAKLVVSMISDQTTTEFLLDYLDKHNPKAAIICMGDTPKEAAKLYEKGASYVMLPHYIGSEKISSFVKRSGLSKTEFNRLREKHIEHMETHKDDVAEAVNDKHTRKFGRAVVENVASLRKIKSSAKS